MKSGQVSENYNITKDTLRYYEKEGLIHPFKEENGYKDYSEEDLKRLLIIQEYRKSGLSIDNIKKVFNNEKTLLSCLDEQADKTLKEIELLEERLLCIQKQILRKRCSFVWAVSSHEKELLFNEEAIVSNQYQEVFLYKDIDKIVLSLCSRAYNAQSKDFINHKSILRLLGYRNMGLTFSYHIDMDIHIHNTVYKFESFKLEDFWKILDLLYSKDIEIEDRLQLRQLFLEKKNMYEIQKYLDYHMKDMAKKFNLDNPRGYSAEELIQLVQKKL